MTLAKGKVFVTKEQLKQLFAMPEEVEIIAVKTANNGIEEGYEFLIMSAEETPLTHKNVPVSLIRRQTIRVERVEIPQPRPVIKGMAEISISGNGFEINNLSGTVKEEKVEKSPQQLFEDIIGNI